MQADKPSFLAPLTNNHLFTTLQMEGICVSHFRITAGTCSEGGFFSGVRAEGIGEKEGLRWIELREPWPRDETACQRANDLFWILLISFGS
jgi:hypothetical protein